jgi:hypothetical protein
MLLTLIEVLIDERGWNPLATLNLKERFENRHPLTGSFTDKQLEDLRVLQGWTAVSVRDQEITADAVACGKPESKGDRKCAYTSVMEQSTHVVSDAGQDIAFISGESFWLSVPKSRGMFLEKGEVQVPPGIFYDTPLTPYLTKP